MRDAVIIFGICIVAIVIGAMLYMNNFGSSKEIPELNPETQVPVAGEQEIRTGPVSFTVIGQGTRAAGVSERKNYAVRTQASFADLWSKVHGDDGELMPEINFDEYQVIGVFSGIRATGGYAISVVSVTDTQTERKVVIALTSPGSECAVTQALTNPYQLIRLPASDLPLKREYVEEVRTCN